MTNRAKQKGTSYESSLVPFLKKYDPDAERRTLSGANDKGDFHTPAIDIALEAKCQKTMSLGSWVDEANKEAENLEVPLGAVIHKRRGTTDPAKQFITMETGKFFDYISNR